MFVSDKSYYFGFRLVRTSRIWTTQMLRGRWFVCFPFGTWVHIFHFPPKQSLVVLCQVKTMRVNSYVALTKENIPPLPSGCLQLVLDCYGSPTGKVLQVFEGKILNYGSYQPKLVSFPKYWRRLEPTSLTLGKLSRAFSQDLLHTLSVCFSPLVAVVQKKYYRGLHTWNGGTFKIKHITFGLTYFRFSVSNVTKLHK